MRLLPAAMLCVALFGCSKGKDPVPAPVPPAAPGEELVGLWLSERDRLIFDFRADRTMGPRSPGEKSSGTWSIPSPGVVRIVRSNGNQEDASYEIKEGNLVVRAGTETHTLVRVPPEEREKILSGAADRAKTVSCKANLKELAMAAILYESRSRKLPASLKDLSEDVRSPRVFRCPLTGREDAYEIVRIADASSAATDALFLHERDPHPDGKRCVATWGGAVVLLDEAAFQQALKEGKVAGGE